MTILPGGGERSLPKAMVRVSPESAVEKLIVFPEAEKYGGLYRPVPAETFPWYQYRGAEEACQPVFMAARPWKPGKGNDGFVKNLMWDGRSMHEKKLDSHRSDVLWYS